MEDQATPDLQSTTAAFLQYYADVPRPVLAGAVRAWYQISMADTEPEPADRTALDQFRSTYGGTTSGLRDLAQLLAPLAARQRNQALRQLGRVPAQRRPKPTPPVSQAA